MATSYTNLPPPLVVNSDSQTLRAFDAYYDKPIELSVATYDATKAFFTTKGFDTVAAESISLVILKQAKKDNLNPMKILDTLRTLNEVEISALVAEVINYNRFKTSFLGYALEYRTNEEVARNVLP